MPENNPLPDAALAELDRWLDIANQPYHAKRKAAKTHAQYMVTQLVPALRQRLLAAESRLAEAERDRDELLANVASPEYRQMLADQAGRHDRDAQQRREGAAEWLEALIAAHRAQRPCDPFVPVQVIEIAAHRLRESG